MNQRRLMNSWLNFQGSIGNNFYNLEDNSRPLFQIREESNSLFPRLEESRNTLHLFNLQNTLNFQDINKKVYHFFQGVKQQPADSKKEGQESSSISINIIDHEEVNKKGLRFLARFVYKIMKQKKLTTHQQVVNFVEKYILKNMNSNKQIQKQGKNIRRRLYDALNVMTAAEILQKSFNKLQIKPQNLKISNRHTFSNKKGALEAVLSEHEARVQAKKQMLITLKEKENNLLSLITRNSILKNSTIPQIAFPLITIKVIHNMPFRLEMNQNQVHFISSEQADIYADMDILPYACLNSYTQFVQRIQTQEEND